MTAVDYELQTPGNRQGKKTYHVNLLKKWHPAEGGSKVVCLALDPEGAKIVWAKKARMIWPVNCMQRRTCIQ